MKKVFGLTLMVAVVISLIGCGQNKAATTTEATTTEAITKEVTTTEAPTTEATVTETVTTEASANDVVKASEELKENVIKTENLDPEEFLEEYQSGSSTRKVFANRAENGEIEGLFEVIIADEGSETVEITLEKFGSFGALLTGDVVDIDGDALHDDLSSLLISPFEGETEQTFSIKYSDGKVVNFIIHFPES